jgi:hypothetical protein
MLIEIKRLNTAGTRRSLGASRNQLRSHDLFLWAPHRMVGGESRVSSQYNTVTMYGVRHQRAKKVNDWTMSRRLLDNMNWHYRVSIGSWDAGWCMALR